MAVANPVLISGSEADALPLKLSPPVNSPLPWLVKMDPAADVVNPPEEPVAPPLVAIQKPHTLAEEKKVVASPKQIAHIVLTKPNMAVTQEKKAEATAKEEKEPPVSVKVQTAMVVLRHPSALPWLVAGMAEEKKTEEVIAPRISTQQNLHDVPKNDVVNSVVQANEAIEINLPDSQIVIASDSKNKATEIVHLTPPKMTQYAQLQEPPAAVPSQTLVVRQLSAIDERVETASGEIAKPLLVPFEELTPAAGEPVELLPPTSVPVPAPALALQEGKLIKELPPITELKPPAVSLAPTPLPALPLAVVVPLPTILHPLPEKAGVADALSPAIAPPPAILPEPKKKLSQDTQDILDRLPPEPSYRAAPTKITLAREDKGKPSVDPVKKRETYGMKLAVKRPSMDVYRALEAAYNSLIAGDQQYAITLYKEVLDQDPENTLALFGLATTYHRAGQLQMARPLYALLLEIDPQNVEGLNNFLVLLADEAPDQALQALAKLQHSHPGFSPVPAQMALIYQKKGEYASAAEFMAKALSISPENLKYQYNMAIIQDKMNDWQQAAKWYQQLVSADERGEKIPGNVKEIQQRLTFIRSNMSSLH